MNQISSFGRNLFEGLVGEIRESLQVEEFLKLVIFEERIVLALDGKRFKFDQSC